MQTKRRSADKTPMHLAIVGGGRTCRFFLESVKLENWPFFKVEIIGVCDINSDAEGFVAARRMGIYTSNDFRDLFKLKDLDGIIELTNNRDVLMELIQHSPKHIGILEYNIGQLLRKLFIADQKLRSAERQILLEQAMRDFFLQQHNQRIIVLDMDFKIREVNDAYLVAINKERSEVIGKHCYNIIHGFKDPCDTLQSAFDCPMLETIRTGKAAHVIQPDPKGGVPPAYNNIVTYPIKDSTGTIVCVIELWQDITSDISTRLEEREKELRSDLNKLIQEDRLISLGKLVASCVHEINNPIQGLLTFGYLIQDILAEASLGRDEIEKLRNFINLMNVELDRCGAIISGLLSFSRESSIARRDINLNDVISSVIDLTRHKMELMDISLRVDLCPESIQIHGDMNQLQQCFLNLVFNSIEAMSSGGCLEVNSRKLTEKKEACLLIRDTGQGIAEKHLNHIFDPFYTTKEMGEGTGMGLSIAYGVIKQHGGEIKVDSNVSEGTTFLLYLPLAT